MEFLRRILGWFFAQRRGSGARDRDPGLSANFTAFFYLGALVEYDRTDVIFTRPSEPRTEDYITGRFG